MNVLLPACNDRPVLVACLHAMCPLITVHSHPCMRLHTVEDTAWHKLNTQQAVDIQTFNNLNTAASI